MCQALSHTRAAQQCPFLLRHAEGAVAESVDLQGRLSVSGFCLPSSSPQKVCSPEAEIAVVLTFGLWFWELIAHI